MTVRENVVNAHNGSRAGAYRMTDSTRQRSSTPGLSDGPTALSTNEPAEIPPPARSSLLSADFPLLADAVPVMVVSDRLGDPDGDDAHQHQTGNVGDRSKSARLVGGERGDEDDQGNAEDLYGG